MAASSLVTIVGAPILAISAMLLGYIVNSIFKRDEDSSVGVVAIPTWIAGSFLLWLVTHNGLKRKWKKDKQKGIIEILEMLERLGIDLSEVVPCKRIYGYRENFD